MKQSIENLITFEEFVEFLRSQPEHIRYELYDGEIIKMNQPSGDHEKIIAFLAKVLMVESARLKLNYGISSKSLVKPENRQSGYYPDIFLLNISNLVNEPRWKKESTLSKPESIPLIIEVASTNWSDDYYKKFADYQEMGIPEYWIIDYVPYGNKTLIGVAKQPTITIYLLNEGEYEKKQFRNGELIESKIFPELNLTAQEIFTASHK